VSASFSVFSGILIASLFWSLPVSWQKTGTLYKVLLIMPHLSIAYFVMIFFSRTGMVSSILHTLGMMENFNQFPVLVYDALGTGIILSYILKGTPFAVLMVSALLKNVDKGYLDTARMLGAGRVRIFTKIIIPSVKPAAKASFLILFLYSFGAFDIPFLIGSSRPEMLSIHVYNLYFRRDLVNRPQAMAVLTLMLLFSFFVIYLYNVISGRLDEREKIL
ncbi:MAG: ABC transporter permease subunit, partial [Spirochaetia bacterium]|nr:ABC transporter permease subunit [Spirochaetia bacterium]